MQSSQRMREVTVRALGTFDIRGEIHRIRAPTLVVVGREDRTCPPAMSETIRDRIPHARLVVVPDSGHLVPVEQPEALARHMLDFLSAVDEGRAAPPPAPGTP